MTIPVYASGMYINDKGEFQIRADATDGYLEPATDPRGGGVGQILTDAEIDAILAAPELAIERIATLEAQLASVQRQREQFARDIAVKLGIDYAPPVAKGDCAYLAAIESLKEKVAALEAPEAAREGGE